LFPIANAYVIKANKAVIVAGEFKIFFVGGYTFVQITTIIIADSHFVGTHTHSYSVLHHFRQT